MGCPKEPAAAGLPSRLGPAASKLRGTVLTLACFPPLPVLELPLLVVSADIGGTDGCMLRSAVFAVFHNSGRRLGKNRPSLSKARRRYIVKYP